MASTAQKQSLPGTVDVLIVGGGVIGLSLAWELAQHGAKVCVVDRGQLGQEASWAGAGMIPPGPEPSRWKAATPIEQLAGLSQRLQGEWHERLLGLTGIDNQYHRCGSLQLAFTPKQAQTLDSKVERWQQLGVDCQTLNATALSEIERTLATQAGGFDRVYHLPDEAQIRNPDHLRALIAACQSAGVDLRPGVAVEKFDASRHRLLRAVTKEASISAAVFCLTTGCWSGQLAMRLGIELPVRPVRGQILLLNGPTSLLQHNINVGPRYLVPRRDGRLLVGSTQEEVGYLKENTTQGLDDLKQFAASISTEIAQLPVETCWSGLRPGSADGLPYLGRLAELENGWLATGHFRAGLQLSPATAVVMRALMLGQAPLIDVTKLGILR